jgi:trk system potassium uptake protein TrkH
MKIRIVLHYLGLLLTGLGLTMLFPLGWSLYYHEPVSQAFATSIAVTTGTGLLLWRLIPAIEGGLSRREALTLVTTSWVIASAFGALPFKLAGTLPSYLDAYFEAMSGYTATGASVLTSIESQPQSILLWRGFTQWLGGMGIITAFVAVLPLFGIGVARLVEAELPGPQKEKLTARTRDTVRVLWYLYIGFSILQFLLLWQAGKIPAFDALTITFGTMATGGFCAKDLSIGAYNNVIVEVIVIAFMVIASINFSLYYSFLWKREPKRLFSNPECRLYIVLLTAGSILIALNLVHSMGLPIAAAFRQSGFQTVSLMATAGFSTADFNLWPPFAKTTLLILMIIGGSAGSTAGGIKVTRLLVVFKYIARRLSLVSNPQAVIPIKIGGDALSETVIARIIGMTMLYITTIIVSTLAMTAVGLDFVSAVSSVVACVGTVGPGLALVGPLANYAFIPAFGKIVLIVCMLVGRLELLGAFSLLTPSFWKWR